MARYMKRFPGTEEYWIQRYKQGGDSGPGSKNDLGEFKAEVINDFIKENNISNIIDFGCGDGNVLKMIRHPNSTYLGLDISEEAILTCRQAFSGDPSKHFRLIRDYRGERADLTLSLDIIFHLVEDGVFRSYMKRLFKASDRYVIIYSSNYDDCKTRPNKHIRHRNFTKWVEKHFIDWKLVRYIANKFPYDGDWQRTSWSDFYIYHKPKVS